MHPKVQVRSIPTTEPTAIVVRRRWRRTRILVDPRLDLRAITVVLAHLITDREARWIRRGSLGGSRARARIVTFLCGLAIATVASLAYSTAQASVGDALDDRFAQVLARVGATCEEVSEDRFSCLDHGLPIEVRGWKSGTDSAVYSTKSSEGTSRLYLFTNATAFGEQLADLAPFVRGPIFVDDQGSIVYVGDIPQISVVAEALGLHRYTPPPHPKTTKE